MTPEQLVDEIVAWNLKRPYRERATRQEILKALLECHAQAVAERDAATPPPAPSEEQR
jgi:hypothetical protein